MRRYNLIRGRGQDFRTEDFRPWKCQISISHYFTMKRVMNEKKKKKKTTEKKIEKKKKIASIKKIDETEQRRNTHSKKFAT